MTLKGALILGPELIINNLENIRKLYKKKDYLIIGDGTNVIKKDDWLPLINQLDKNTRIDIISHGSVKGDSHFITLFKQPSLTSDTFNVLGNALGGKALNLHLWSCSGQYAISAINSLPKGSVLTIHGSHKFSYADLDDFSFEQEIINMQKSNLNLLPYQSFLINMAGAIQDAHIVTKIGKKIHTFSVSPTLKEILEDAKGFLTNKALEFSEFYNKLQIKSLNKIYYLNQAKLTDHYFTNQEVDSFRVGKFISNCDNNDQIIANKDLLLNESIAATVINKDIASFTPLHAASSSGNFNVVKLLLELGAEVNKVGVNGCNALYMASSFGHLKAAELLIKYGAEVDAVTDSGVTALFIASKNNYFKLVKLLIKFGADIDKAQDNKIYTPLVASIAEGHIEVSKLLLKCNPAPLKEEFELNYIMIAQEFKNYELVSLLESLESGEIKYNPEECPSYNKMKLAGNIENIINVDGE